MKLKFLILIVLLSCVKQPCEIISNDYNNGMNIIFFLDGFDYNQGQNLSNYFIETIKQKEPFASKPYFNFYYINNTNDSICIQGTVKEMFGDETKAPPPPLKCNVEKIKEMINTCNIKKGKIVVFTNDTVVSQTSVTYKDSGVMFMDMKNQLPEVMQHEFGHFFGLRDEQATLFSYALGIGRTPGPNCAESIDHAKIKFGQFFDEEKIIKGCAGNPEWYASEGNVLMSRHPDPSWEYGGYDSWYLEMVMDCCYSGNQKIMSSESCSDFLDKYYVWQDE